MAYFLKLVYEEGASVYPYVRVTVIKCLNSFQFRKFNPVKLEYMVIVVYHIMQEVAESVKEDFGTIDILVHSLANGPEVCIFVC